MSKYFFVVFVFSWTFTPLSSHADYISSVIKCAAPQNKVLIRFGDTWYGAKPAQTKFFPIKPTFLKDMSGYHYSFSTTCRTDNLNSIHVVTLHSRFSVGLDGGDVNTFVEIFENAKLIFGEKMVFEGGGHDIIKIAGLEYIDGKIVVLPMDPDIRSVWNKKIPR